MFGDATLKTPHLAIALVQLVRLPTAGLSPMLPARLETAIAMREAGARLGLGKHEGAVGSWL